MRLTPASRACAVALLAAAACSGPPDATDAPEAAAADAPAATALSRAGLVVLEHDRGEPGVGVRGQLFEAHGLAASEALALLALPEVEWLTMPVDRGACVLSVPHAAPLDDAGERRLTLLGAGPLQLEYGGAALRVEPAALPRVLFALRGVVYDASADEALPFAARALYRVRADGDEVARFEGHVVAPEVPELVGHALEPAGLRVRFSAPEGARVILARERPDGAAAVVCAPSASDALLVPRPLVEALGGGALELAVARVERAWAPTEGPGALEGVQLLFVSRDHAEVVGVSGEAPL